MLTPRIKHTESFITLQESSKDANFERTLLGKLIIKQVAESKVSDNNKTVKELCQNKGINIQALAIYCFKSGTPETLKLFKSLIIEIN
jgi:hypothetical protein